MGLSQTGVSFRMGPISPKQPKPHKMKRTTGGSQKKNIENRGLDGKDMASGKESMQTQGEGRAAEVL